MNIYKTVEQMVKATYNAAGEEEKLALVGRYDTTAEAYFSALLGADERTVYNNADDHESPENILFHAESWDEVQRAYYAVQNSIALDAI